jgi:class 3 adenylate cyclase
MDVPETRFAKNGPTYIPYQVVGDSDLDILVFLDAGMALDVMWGERAVERFVGRLASFGRVIIVQSRGWATLGADRTLETNVADALAVLDVVGSDEAAIFAPADGGLSGIFMAATYPARTRALVLCNAYARLFAADGYSFGFPPELEDQLVARVEDGWGTGASVNVLAPSRSADDAFRRWCAKSQRVRAAPNEAGVAFRMWIQRDVRDVLPAIRVPTLVLHRSANPYVRVEHGRYLAEHIGGARYVELPGHDHMFIAGDIDDIVDEVEQFLTGTRRALDTDRVLATMLFTDIVSSTEKLAAAGDRRWMSSLDRHDAIMASELTRYGGQRVKTTGDGILATFDGPARAIRCATAIRDELRNCGLEIRAGLHTGEVQVMEGDLGGIAVHIAARVAALAEGGEVLVSSTVKDLVAGSGMDFADRGTHVLKGVPDEWRLFAVAV